MLYDMQNIVYDVVSYLTLFIYLALEFGLLATAPQYLDDLEFYTKLYVALFLIIRFNPLKQTTFTKLDNKIAFGAGLFLLTTSAFTTILTNKLSHLSDFYHKITTYE
jgi:hypothetical protein